MSLLDAKPIYKPFAYPWAYEAWLTQQRIHWLPEEVPLADDVKDWRNKLTESERHLLTQIFRFFTQADVEVNNCYMRHYSRVFKPTEVQMMLAAFSAMETVHVAAYSHLLDTIGMPETEYSAFLTIKEMKDKYDYMQAFNVDSKADIAKTLADGMVVKVSGKIAGTDAKMYVANPEIDRSPLISPDEAHDSLFASSEADDTTTLYPIYPESQGISSLWFTHAIRKVFETHAHELLEDPIPEPILAKFKLPSLVSAIVFVHAPHKKSDADAARKRFAFEEIFSLQLAVQKRRRETRDQKALPVSVDRTKLQDFVASFPFPATEAQLKAIDQVVSDFEKSHPMTRLLEGDVGSGKTAVAAATAYLVATSLPTGRIAGTLQVAYLCPTEVLAKQHYSTFVSYFKDHPIPIGLITGSECRKFPSRVRYEESAKLSKAAFKKMVANGEIPIVIGTHALLKAARQVWLDERALAVTMAIMTQVHVSRIRFHHFA